MRQRPFRTSLSRSLRLRRRARGMTQRRLAQEAGITEKYLSRVELGLVTPSVLIAVRLARALDLTLDQLVEVPPERVHPTSAAIARVLRDRSDQELDLARRLLVELFR